MTTVDLQQDLPAKMVWHKKLLQYNIVRFMMAALFIGGSLALLHVFTGKFVVGPELKILRNFLNLVVGVSAYIAYVRLIEKRAVTELTLLPAWREWLAGLALGVSLFIVVLGLLSVAGVFRVDGFNSPATMLPFLPIFIGVAVMEEIVFRGIVFRLLEDSLGSTVALVLSGLIFGFAHISNPGATWFSSLAIALEAGFTFGAIYMLTRRLALCIGFHFAWNFTQGAVFSVAVSGMDAKGWMQSRMTGPDWLTGGNFGAEASLLTVALATMIGVLFLRAAIRKGEFKRRFWSRPTKAAQLAV